MKKKSGFTLIELLAVIVIVGILLIIAIPSVSRYLKRGTDEYYKNLEKTVLLSGRDYLNDYKTLFPKEIGNVTVVPLNELLINNYVDPVLDSNKKECDAKFTVKKVDKNQYEYYSCLICDNYKTEGDFCNYTEEDNVTPETKNYKVEVDKDYYTVEQGKTFELPYARAYYLNELVSDKVVGSPRIIDTNKLGVTVVTYSYQGAKKQIKVEVIDSVSPSIPQVVLKKENENGSIYKGGWVNTNIYALFKSTDYTKDNLNGSGVSYYEISKDGKNWTKIDGNGHLMTEDGDYNYFVRSVDKARNVSPANSYNVKIDKKVPTCSLKVVSGTLGKNGWYTSDVRVDFDSLNDDRSGVKNSSIDIKNITYDVKNRKVTGTVVDNAGNSGTCSINVSVDKTNPRVEYSTAGGVSNSNKTITVNAIDTYFDYMNIHVYKNGAVNNATNNIKNTSNSYTLDHGSWTIYTQAYDESGRKQEQNPDNGSGWYYQTYVVDTVAPTCSLKVASGTLGKNGWYISDVGVDFETTDGTGSNIIMSSVSNQTVTGTMTVTGTVTDSAGNIGSCSIYVKVDKDKPSCSFAGENSNWTSQNRTLTATCSDSTSGCSSSTASKQWTYSSGTTKTAYLSYGIEDNAGNSATCGKTVNVYVDKDPPTIPTGGAIGNVSGSNQTGYIQTGGSGSTDTGSGNITYKYIVSNSSTTPANSDSRFATKTDFTRSCGSTYYAWVIAEDGVGNRSAVKYIGATSDGADSYSGWSSCSKTCGGGTQTRTNTCALVTTELSQSCNEQSCRTFIIKNGELQNNYNYDENDHHVYEYLINTSTTKCPNDDSSNCYLFTHQVYYDIGSSSHVCFKTINNEGFNLSQYNKLVIETDQFSNIFDIGIWGKLGTYGFAQEENWCANKIIDAYSCSKDVHSESGKIFTFDVSTFNQTEAYPCITLASFNSEVTNSIYIKNLYFE